MSHAHDAPITSLWPETYYGSIIRRTAKIGPHIFSVAQMEPGWRSPPPQVLQVHHLSIPIAQLGTADRFIPDELPYGAIERAIARLIRPEQAYVTFADDDRDLPLEAPILRSAVTAQMRVPLLSFIFDHPYLPTLVHSRDE